MKRARREQYLKALGIESWRLRDERAESREPLEAPAVAAAAAPLGRDAAAPPRGKQSRPRGAPAEPRELASPEPRVPSPEPPRPEVPGDWTGLRAMVKDCRHCKLCATRTQSVFGVGSEAAPLMVIGEGPGADEDAQGEPFVGRAGKLLDEMLKAIGRSRRDSDPARAVFIANVVKCRPPGNRDPEVDEVEACRPYLDRQIELVQPKLIVALGRIAAQRLLATDAPLSKLRGPLYRYGPTQTPLLITYHPAYLLRSPREKAKSWEDLKKIHRLLNESAT